MKKLIKDISQDKNIHYIIIFVATLIAAIPLINLRIYGTDDGYVHLLRIIGTDKTLHAGIFPPLITSNFCRGFGYSLNLFYPPIVTYGPLFFKLFFTHYYTCLKIYTFFTILISGYTMYHFIYDISKKRQIALIASIIYIFIPYRLETIYNRFAIGEFTAYVFLPLLFQGLYNLIQGDGKKHYYIAIAGIGLMLSHTITTEYAAIFAFIYLLLNIKKVLQKDVLRKLGINLLFILLICAFFIVPLIEHKIYGDYAIFSAERMESTPEDVQNGAIKFVQIFKDIEENGVSFKLGIPLIIFSLLGIFTYRKMNKDYKGEYLSFLLIAIISLVMTTNIFPWKYMPSILTTLQYSWRLLTFFEFAIAILAGLNLYTLIQIIAKDKENINNVLCVISIIMIVISMAKINYNYHYEDAKSLSDEEYESSILSKETLSHFSINREYLPINASNVQSTYLNDREDRVYVLSGQADIINEQKHGLHLEFDVSNAIKGTELELPYIYYLGYDVKINDKNIDTYESNNGFVTIKIPEDLESAHIVVQYKGTILEKVSYVISLIALIGFIIYIIKGRKLNERKDEIIN